MIDKAHRLTQTNAILRYLARKHNLCGEMAEEKIRVDVLEREMVDLGMYSIRTCYSPDFEKQKVLKVLPEKMKLFSEFLGKKSWFAGDKVTGVDLMAWDSMDVLLIFDPRCWGTVLNLKDFSLRA